MTFFSNKRLIVLMVSIIILVALIGYSMSDRDRVTWPEQFMKDTVGWVQTLVSKPAQFAAGFFENLNELQGLYAENQVLKARLEEYAQVSVERNMLKAENDTLKATLEIEETLSDFRMRTATVIHRNPDRWSEFIGINRGSEHGIQRNMAVITAGGLIGKVHQVGQFSSKVQLLTDNDRTNRVSAMVQAEVPAYGFIEGFDPETGMLMLKKLDIDADIEVEQTVTTSGLGGVYPRGLIIGEIVQIEPDEYGLTKNAYIQPAADFYGLDYVIVIERTSTTLDPELTEGDGL
ncbi:rod shape-determining protein MreC [Alkalihalobacterium chitinilyticum]|uniref:Cell shape-determining protein MreC n=1 Tax=Alkalihalobacterium chitinilyticum TaxID=2980103 RepID=A0ABT5VAH1_9BACI|nr:rod shape-determining protein MreC [Alkalihalobacterium chitinilyticum]MDE5412446.1 rod shape-determining protein MreC [Alkalihalobacterium chitinilyticum]